MIVIPNGNREQRGFSGDLWGKRPYWRAASDPTYGTFRRDDFAPYLAEDYTISALSGAGSSAVASTTGRHGIIELDSGSTTQHDGVQIALGDTAGAWIAPQTQGTFVIEGLFELQAALTQPSFFFGIGTVNAAAITDGAMNATNAVGFFCDGADLNIDFITKNNASTDTQTSIGAFVAGQWIKLGFEIHNDTSITPVINGIRMTSNVVTDTADIPDNTDWMRPCIAAANGTTERIKFNVDWYAFWQSDQQDIVGT